MNKKIIAAGVVIIGTGLINAAQHNGSFTKVVLGGYVFLLMLSLMDTFGGGLSQISGGLAMVAMLYVLINQFPWQSIGSIVSGSNTPSTNAKKQGA